MFSIFFYMNLIDIHVPVVDHHYRASSVSESTCEMFDRYECFTMIFCLNTGRPIVTLTD